MMGALQCEIGSRRPGPSKFPQVICHEGQQKAADVPVHDDGGEAQDTPGPWQHLGVWNTTGGGGKVSQNPAEIPSLSLTILPAQNLSGMGSAPPGGSARH